MADRRWAARAVVLLSFSTLALACASTADPSRDVDDGAPRIDGGHAFFDDRFLPPPDRVPAADVPDTDAPDAAVGPVVCTDRRGNVCPDGLACPAESGCNWCECNDHNRDLAICTLVGCADAGPGTCARSTDCSSPGRCVYFQGCAGTEGRCVNAQLQLGSDFTLCGCDGMTFPSGRTPLRPYAHAGACP